MYLSQASSDKLSTKVRVLYAAVHLLTLRNLFHSCTSSFAFLIQALQSLNAMNAWQVSKKSGIAPSSFRR